MIPKLTVTPPVCTKFSSKPSVYVCRRAAERRYQIGARGLLRRLNLFICIQKTQILFHLPARIRGDESVPVRGEGWPGLGGAQSWTGTKVLNANCFKNSHPLNSNEAIKYGEVKAFL